ncbi:MFS transporter [Cellulomonas sp. P5_C6]
MTAVATGFDRRLTAPLILGSVLNPINSSMLAVALIPIGLALGAPPSQTVWLVSALYLATAVGQPVVGRLVDLFGPRRLYLVGTALVGIAGVAGALAPDLGVLVGSRVLLGLGTCAAFPAAMSLLRSESLRTGQDSPTGILTALSVANQSVAIIGPTLGGLLIAVGGWRTIFTINIPLSIACLILGWLRLPRTASRTGSVSRLDLAGIGLFAAMLTALMLFLMNPRAGDWYLLAITLASATALAVRELRVAEPFLDLRLLRGNAPLLATFGRQLLNSTAIYAFLYGYVQWLEAGRGMSAAAAGLLLLPMSLAAVVASAVSGRYRELRGKLVIGSCSLIVGCTLLLLAGTATATWVLIGLAGLVGVSQGLNGLANQNALYRQAETERMGSAAGLLRTFTYLGAIVAAAVVAAAYATGAHTGGLHRLAALMLVCGIALLLVSVLDRSLRLERHSS